MSLSILHDWITSKVRYKDARDSCVYSDVIFYNNSRTFYRKLVWHNCDDVTYDALNGNSPLHKAHVFIHSMLETLDAYEK